MPRFRPRDPSDADEPYDDPFDADDKFDAYDIVLRDADGALNTAAPVPPPRGGARLTWKERLGLVESAIRAVDTPSEPWPAGRELVYVVDVARSGAGYGLVVEVRARDRESAVKLRNARVRIRDIPSLPDPADR